MSDSTPLSDSGQSSTPLSDLDIARRAVLRPIEEIAAAAGIDAESVELNCRFKAKNDPPKQ